MPGSFICGVWISVSVLLYGSAAFASNISTQIRPPNVTEEEYRGWESPFLQLRANLLSYSQPIHPYTLLTNAEDYHYMPKPRHRRPSRLRRLLGSSFDPFWMSVEQPSEASGGQGDGQPSLRGDTLHAKLPKGNTAREKFNLSACPELREAAANHRRKLEKEAADLDLSSQPSHVASSVRDWLVRSATCGLSYRWVDLGPAFWPRWLRQTDCERSDGEQSCSFPAGMECVRDQTTYIKILAWHCLDIRERSSGSGGIKADGSNGSTEMATGEVMKGCMWRQVPYPVVTACTCSCK
ncbi:noggin-3-like [Chelmon rostratus]|uniref:noggin-3-like n=1 Tax=Chelmon rostratus TaxID=109905 RepID=UPI001BE73B14|nr:noggin-3-like [Chelmon rostratus]